MQLVESVHPVLQVLETESQYMLPASPHPVTLHPGACPPVPPVPLLLLDELLLAPPIPPPLELELLELEELLTELALLLTLVVALPPPPLPAAKPPKLGKPQEATAPITSVKNATA